MNTTSFWGGGEKWHYETAIALANKGYQISFIVEKGSELEEKLNESQIEVISIRTTKWSFLNPFFINKVARILLDLGVQALLFNGPKDLKIGGLAAEKAKVKKVVYRRGIAVEVKSSYLYKRLFNNVVTHFVFNSSSTQSLLEKKYKKELKNKHTTVIFNAIEFPGSAVDSPKVVNKKFIIGNAGRLVEQKGQENLLEIASILKEKGIDFEIRIAGDGPLKERLAREISKRGLSNEVELIGFVEDIPRFMKSIDVLVSTALWEGFGFVLAEAMIQRKPVLAYDLSSNPELVNHELNGYLIPAGNNEVFAHRIEHLAKHEELCEKMGNAGYAFAKSNFEAEGQLQKLISFLDV